MPTFWLGLMLIILLSNLPTQLHLSLIIRSRYPIPTRDLIRRGHGRNIINCLVPPGAASDGVLLQRVASALQVLVNAGKCWRWHSRAAPGLRACAGGYLLMLVLPSHPIQRH